jgi:predicted CXXCH cytochrome family protein
MSKKKRKKTKALPVPEPSSSKAAETTNSRKYTILFALSGILISACILWFAFYRHHRVDPPKTLSSNAYVDSRTCAECHRAIAESFGHTGMGRSVSRATSDNMPEDFAVRNTVYNKASGDYYAMIRRGDEYYQRRHQIGFDGKEANVAEERVDYVIGSGDQARSFLHRTSDGKLVELPVTWYSEKNGYWEMTPGYEFANQKDFHGIVSKGCIFCHDAYPSALPREIEESAEPIFPDKLPSGIDCQRCHGPGAEHERAAKAKDFNFARVRAAIVNPATLGRERQLEVCMECHLSTSGSQDKNISVRFNRDIFSYRPGQPLGDYKLYFDVAGKQNENGFEIADTAYRLRMSRCFKQSQMTCLTCHDPHQELHNQQTEANYVKVCKGCHEGVVHKAALPATETCVSCHMPRRRGEFAVHIVLTDHYIQREKPSRDLLAPLEPHPASSDNKTVLAPYYPEKLRDRSDDQLYMAIAESENAANPQGAAALESTLKAYAPAQAEFYAALGDAYAKSGSYAQAVTWFEEARKRNPENRVILGRMVEALLQTGELDRAQHILESVTGKPPADPGILSNLGNVFARQGQLQKAESTLQQAIQLDPEQAQSYNLLGGVKETEGDQAEAIRLYREAIRYRPDLAEGRYNLARALVANNQFEEAEFQFKQAIAAAPMFAEIHHSYGLLLVATNRRSQAEDQFREAVRSDPGSAVIHSDLGDLLSERHDEQEAIQQYREALRLNANLDAANLGLGMILVRQGNVTEGKVYCGNVLHSADSSLVEMARSCLLR